ncbi:MAG: HWE histidine kinase domain-containing protein [Bauldia sp.]
MTLRRDFFSGGGEMGALMRACDWAATPLGPAEAWPQSLRTTVRILLTTEYPMFIWWGPELIQFYNDAYRATMGPERHPSALGQRGRECWEEIWETIGPQITYVMNGEGATWHEDQLVPVTRHGKREDVWWTYSFSPIDDETAATGVGGVLVVCHDVTDQHQAFENLRANQERVKLALSSGLVGTWDWHVPEDRVFADERFAAASGVDPARSAEGVPAEAFINGIHPDDRVRVRAMIDDALRTGGAFQAEYRLTTRDGSVRWVVARGHCFHDAAGVPTRFPGAAVDITARKQAEDHRELIAREMNHRLKNLLLMVQSIANQTFKDDVDLADARNSFAARLQAMSAAQDILTGARWAGANIEDVVSSALRATGGERIEIGGPSQRISRRSAFSLSLALHELATNAAKYGASSVADGRIAVTWRTEDSTGGAPRLILTWQESGGPPVKPPSRKGFGSRLIEGVLAVELDAAVSVSYAPAGVVWTIDAPLGNWQDRDYG